MKKVLYIDPFSTMGHLNFNKIYINEILKEDVIVDFLFRSYYSSKLGINNNFITIPENLFTKSDNRFITRLYEIKKLRFINKILALKSYDIVIMSSYDEISLYLNPIKSKLFLINHNNLIGLENQIKLFVYKKISKNNIQIVFEDYIKKYVNSIGISGVIKINHGLPEKFKVNDNMAITSLRDLNIEQYKNLVFVPSSSSSDHGFISKLINNSYFQKYLNENNILLIVKGNFKTVNNQNIQVIKKYLSKLEYRYLFIKSSIIIIKYPASFKNRTSAVFMECVANDKIALISKIKAFNELASKINYNPYFATINELINKIDVNLKNPPLRPYVDKQEFNVDVTKMFKAGI